MRAETVTRYLASLGRWKVVVLGVLLMVALGYLDYVSGAEISFSIFYLVPIAFVAWFAGPHESLAIAALSAVTWYLADLWAGSDYSNELIPVWNALMRLGFFVIVVWSITRIKRALRERDELARTDSLTGTCNSRCFYEIAEQELKRSRRYGSPLSFAYIDLDNFKEVNDSLGHTTGDELLRLVADTLSGSIRAVDVTARLGGDEFALLLPETDYFGSDTALVKIKELLDHNMGKMNWPVTFSIGLVTFLKPPDAVEEMIHESDQLMYKVKGGAKDAILHEVRGAAGD